MESMRCWQAWRHALNVAPHTATPYLWRGKQAKELNDPCDEGSGQERPEGLAGCGWKPHRSPTPANNPSWVLLNGMRQHRSSDQTKHFAEDGASSKTRISAQHRCHKPHADDDRMVCQQAHKATLRLFTRQMMCSCHPSMTSHVFCL